MPEPTSSLIDLVLTHAARPAVEQQFADAVADHVAAVRASAGRGDRGMVARAEQAVRDDPAAAFAFDADGSAKLTADGQTWLAGRFTTPTIRELRAAVAAMPGAGGGSARARLWVLDGASPATDIGSLQATVDGALFQAASQFNCLEAPGSYLVPVSNYLSDPTQGPRAAISAFPATLLRHYAAPAADGGRFVQTSDGPQVELLADACGPGACRNGYFTGRDAADPAALVAKLVDRFESIRVGVVSGAEVVLGYNWDGGVADPRPRVVSQVYTSTVAGGGYGGERSLGPIGFNVACRQLLRAAYLGTLLAAASLGHRRAVLTLIGGGVFGNPARLIVDAIDWAVRQVEPLLPADLDVIVNGYNLGYSVDLERDVLPLVRPSGGAVCAFDRRGLMGVMR